MNPMDVMKLMNAKNEFEQRHPKAVAFVNKELMGEMPAGTVIEISLTRPGQNTVSANLRITPEDLEMLKELKGLSR